MFNSIVFHAYFSWINEFFPSNQLGNFNHDTLVVTLTVVGFVNVAVPKFSHYSSAGQHNSVSHKNQTNTQTTQVRSVPLLSSQLYVCCMAVSMAEFSQVFPQSLTPANKPPGSTFCHLNLFSRIVRSTLKCFFLFVLLSSVFFV